MAELVKGASYPAKLNGQIVVQLSKKNALMAYIPYSLIGVEFQENYSMCIGTKDGVKQEANIQSLRDIFGWNTNNPVDLQRLTFETAPEFKMVDWHPEPYTNDAGKEIDKWAFRFMNRAGSGISAATDTDEAAILAMWGEKFETGTGEPAAKSTKKAKTAPVESKPVEAEVVASTPKRALKSAAPRKSNQAEVVTLLCAKHGIKENSKDAAEIKKFEDLSNDVYFKATDELFGAGKDPVTPEDYGKLADHLGL